MKWPLITGRQLWMCRRVHGCVKKWTFCTSHCHDAYRMNTTRATSMHGSVKGQWTGVVCVCVRWLGKYDEIHSARNFQWNFHRVKPVFVTTSNKWTIGTTISSHDKLLYSFNLHQMATCCKWSASIIWCPILSFNLYWNNHSDSRMEDVQVGHTRGTKCWNSRAWNFRVIFVISQQSNGAMYKYNMEIFLPNNRYVPLAMAQWKWT